jgi:dTDP-4-amino-4,6-dideoxygalactose transaminase
MVPFNDLRAHHEGLRAEILAAVGRVVDSSQFILGDEVAAFERDFAAFCGTRFAVAVNSGTSALHLALLAAGVGPGDEVVTVPFTFVATVSAITYTGARPVFVDVEPRTLQMDVARLEAALTPRTKAILPVHLYGHPADMRAILDVGRRRGISVIEDACQAHGATCHGAAAGSMGDLGCFSFYPGKNLGAWGEGGIVVTNDEARAKDVRMRRDWGQERRYHHVVPGFNYRMEGVQGAVLRVKLRRLAAWVEQRRSHAARYHERLAACVDVQRPETADGVAHAFHLYVVRSAHRDALQAHLHDKQVQTGIHYPIPVHLQEAFRDLGHRGGDFPVAESAADSVLSLPLFPEMTAEQVDEAADAVLSFRPSGGR